MKRRTFVKTLAGAGTGVLVSSAFRRLLYADPVHPDPEVKRVLVMFKCHFDAGFIDTQANVVHRYFTEYFPKAIEVSRAANASGKRRYVWTTGSWLLFEYLEQAGPDDRKAMEDAITRGDIAWHALPFTWQSEMLTPSMIEGSLALSQSLDRRFGKVTTGAKMTDVPGHTRGIIQPLAKHGVNFLEIGVNGGSTPADLPPIFLWKDPLGQSLPMMYHHEYGAVTRVPGSDLALVTAVRDDNSGPHTAEEIDHIHGELAKQFPNAEISAANLSEMATALAPFRDKLPVVTQEIGDTWIYGCPSDPLKVARYRELSRLREKWLGERAFQRGDATDLALLRHVLLEVEHTWGTDTKTWLDFDHYKPDDLDGMLDTKNYKVVEFSWNEKRQDLLDGIATLPSALRTEAQRAIEALVPTEPTQMAGRDVRSIGGSIETDHFVLGIDHVTGAITRLTGKSSGREWASAQNPIALLSYQTLSHQDYDHFLATYLTTKADWAAKDFGKPNIEKFGAASRIWTPSSTNGQVQETEEGHRILIYPRFQDDMAFDSGRAAFPRRAMVELFLPRSEASLRISVFLFEKPATRLPEAMWLSFKPIAKDQHGWSLDKCGQQVSPFDVVSSGNRHMHALSEGFQYDEGEHSFSVETLDSPVVALGERTPLGFSNAQPDLNGGVHACLFNNAWGTNYIMWYGEDMRFRFVVRA